MPIHKPVTNPKGGRPEVALTPEELTQLERMAGFLNQKQCAAILGIHENTLTQIRKRDESVDVILKRAQASKNLDVMESLYKNATEKMNPISQIFWCKTMGGLVEATPQHETPTINITYTQAPDRIERDVTPRHDPLELDSDG